jgi:DNA-binding transcriptional regulator YiaG
MPKLTPVTPLVLALTDPSLCPNGARHNSIVAGLVFMNDVCHGIIRVVWNASYEEPADGAEPTLKKDTVFTWRESSLQKADHEMVCAAWSLGAWDVLRTWHQPLGSNADSFAPHHGLVSLFDPSEAFAVRTGPMGMRDKAINVREIVETAAQEGWITWKFRPVLRSTRVGGRVAARDVTLARDGTRAEPCSYEHVPPMRGERRVIQLGREEASSTEPWTLSNQGATLRSARQRLGLSADGLATTLRLGSNGGRTIRRWEAGEVPISGPAQLAIELLVNGIRR